MKKEHKGMIRYGITYAVLTSLVYALLPFAFFARPQWTWLAIAAPGGFLLGCAQWYWGSPSKPAQVQH